MLAYLILDRKSQDVLDRAEPGWQTTIAKAAAKDTSDNRFFHITFIVGLFGFILLLSGKWEWAATIGVVWTVISILRSVWMWVRGWFGSTIYDTKGAS